MNREIKFKFWSKVLNHFVIPDDSIFVGALKDENMAAMQYTGLKDKNEKEIYEGDIVSDENNDIFTIDFSDGCFWATLITESEEKNTYIAGSHDEWEVIGNIWENGDLLN